MAEGWSWDPTRPLGDRDSNAFWPSLMPAHQIANGSKPTVSNLFGHNNENATPPHAATPTTGPSHHHARPAASPNAAPDANSPAQPEPASETESKPKAPASRKRKSEAAPEEPAADDLPEISDDDPRLQIIDESANQVRNKIRRFIESGAMKIGEFQDAINVSPAAYRRFMNYTGTRQGEGSDVYSNAFAFFKKRELQGLKAVPPKKKARASTGPKDTGKTEKQKASELLDVSDITLEGEEEGDVPVFDTCDELRKKIRAFLKRDGATQASLCRAISALLPGDQTVQARQMTTFLGKKGPVHGNISPIFYGGYIFFEKLRIKENKKKSKFREEMEEIYKAGSKHKSLSHRDDGKAGISTKCDLSARLFLAGGERLTEDKYGQLEIIRVGKK